MEKHAVAIAVFVFACSLPIIASSLRVDPSFDIHELSLQFDKKSGPLDYYKLGLEWPKSVCNINPGECELPIKKKFVIHCLQPFYCLDNLVPPFNESGCSRIRPSPPDTITEEYLRESGILHDMIKFWPNRYGYSDMSLNLALWRRQWTRFGMCSTYPVSPHLYFKVALGHIGDVHLKNILAKADIVPGDKKYEPGEFAKAIKAKLGVDVQIRCENSADNINQFAEVYLCLNKKDNNLTSCPTIEYYNCDNKILFP